jgi:hypothetical protein
VSRAYFKGNRISGEGQSHAVEYGGKITESILAKALGISNGPVREAVFRLRRKAGFIPSATKALF